MVRSMAIYNIRSLKITAIVEIVQLEKSNDFLICFKIVLYLTYSEVGF